MNISPSQIAIEAAGLPPVGVVQAKEDGYCAMCGFPHKKGEMVAPFAPTDSFTDYPALRGRTSKVICGWCASTWKWNVEFTQSFLKTVMCKQGVFKAASNLDIAYWLTNPPEGSWIWVMGSQQRQHIVWKATVNTSREIFQVMLDETVMTIRRKKVFEAVDASRRLAAAASVGRKGAPLKIPFARLSRDLDDPSHGGIRRDLHTKAITDPAVRADIKIIQSCTPGELWALTALMYAKPADKPIQYFPKNR